MEFKEKFIGFVDVLGFENLVERAERGEGMRLPDILEALDELGSEADKSAIDRYGPTICPDAARVNLDVDFQLTQVSDCVIVSTEISPAGVITLANHCWKAVTRLLRRGLMCRGHIRRGTIAHEGARFIGTGYQEAAKREKVVSGLRSHPEEVGTPFVEIDAGVTEYVRKCGEACVQEMFGRLTYSADDFCALFPFKRLSTSFTVRPDFDPRKEERNNDTVRQWIVTMKRSIDEYVDINNQKAVRKSEHYKSALDKQLAECDKADEMINTLETTFPAGRK